MSRKVGADCWPITELVAGFAIPLYRCDILMDVSPDPALYFITEIFILCTQLNDITAELIRILAETYVDEISLVSMKAHLSIILRSLQFMMPIKINRT